MDAFLKRNKIISLRNPLFFDAECKICCDNREVGNELYSMCSCKGTIQWTHQICHLKWINHLKKKKKNYKICEVCKGKFKKITIQLNKNSPTLSAQICHILS